MLLYKICSCLTLTRTAIFEANKPSLFRKDYNETNLFFFHTRHWKITASIIIVI